MPIIGNVGRRSTKVRVLNVVIHVILLVGGVTMVYPFLVMLAGTIKSPVDRMKLEVIPSYLYDDGMLYKKYIDTKYNEKLSNYAYSVKSRPVKPQHIMRPAKIVAARNKDWNAFLDEVLPHLSEDFYGLGHSSGFEMIPELQYRFQQELKAEEDVGGKIDKLNDKYDAEYAGWEIILVPRVGIFERAKAYPYSKFLTRAVDFVQRQGREYYLFRSLDAYFVTDVLKLNHTSDLRKMNAKLKSSFRSWQEVCLSRTVPPEGDPLRPDWITFVREKLNIPFVEVTEAGLPAYRKRLGENYGDDISLMNERYGATYGSFDDVQFPEEPPRPGDGFIYQDWEGFISGEDKDRVSVDVNHLRIGGLEFMYRDFLEKKYGSVEKLNQAHEFGLKDLAELAVPEAYPRHSIPFQDDWKAVLDQVAAMGEGWAYAASPAREDYRKFLTAPFKKMRQVKKKVKEKVIRDGKEVVVKVEKLVDEEYVDIDVLNEAYGTDFETDQDILLPRDLTAYPAKLIPLWREFLTEKCKPELLRMQADEVEPLWQEHLRNRYESVDKLNAAYGLAHADFTRVVMPIEQADYFTFLENKGKIKREFVVRNYRAVLDLMAGSGRAILNTVIYCALTVLCALLVNPLAAYALSRYKPPSAYKILLFFMLTMAFPPMVLGIPSFLLLRKLHLLNTFAALILPGMANGYSIFLLKGFFDSLPRELYESASLDGASEWTMFWVITMATSKPILAVIALGAFTAAYGNFMMAFIMCQDPKMWTMMVNVYQIMVRYSPDISYAAIAIAAIPTFIIFVFCQNIIIRGIVVPTEK